MRPGPSTAAWREGHRLLRRHRGPLGLALGLIAVNRGAGLALPTASRYVVDEVIGRQRSDLLGLIALLACGAVAIEAATAFGAAQVAGIAGQRAIAALRQELQARVIGLPIWRLDASQTGALAARVMTDSEQARYLVGNGLVQLVASILTATLALSLLFWLDAPLTLAVISIVGLVALGVKAAFGRITMALDGVTRRQSDLTGWFSQVLGGFSVVKAYVAERHEAHRFARESHQLIRESVHALRSISLLNAGGILTAGSLGVLLLVLGGQSVGAGQMSLGSYVMYVWLTGLLLGPVFHIAGSAGELGRAVAALGRVAELRGLATEEEEDRTRSRIPHVVGRVDLEEVSYGYVSGRPVLRAVGFNAPAGSTTALVGPSGSGKSTLCRLLLAYDRPTAGRILIDGHDLVALHRGRYRSHLGVVLQETFLFDGTIGENIRYGRPGASLAEVQAAGRLAHCDEFVSQLPEAYSTRVGERGLRLSAGQRQRVAIARAFLVNPRILILDEATASLDAESEAAVQEALRILSRGRTTFVIAHRLSTVRGADRIVVLEQGSIAEQGTHEELVARRGPYFRMCGTQSRDASDRHSPVAPWRAAGLPAGPAEGVADLVGGNGHAR